MPRSSTAPLVSSSELAISTATVIAETVKLLVNSPHKVSVETRTSTTSVTLLVRVAPDDIGVVIGRQGRTARSLRVLLNAISSHSALPFELDIYTEHS